jgi:hypothetical protein
MIGYRAIADVVVSYALASGLFDAVNGHEPKSAPGNGVTCGVWASDIAPVQSSGLASVSVRLALTMRFYTPMITYNSDEIDPRMVDAVDTMMTAFIGDFNLGGSSRNIDIFGHDGEQLKATPGYINQDNKLYRTFDILIPIIINDAWTEVA